MIVRASMADMENDTDAAPDAPSSPPISDGPIRKRSSTVPSNLGLFPGAPAVRNVPRRNFHRAIDGVGGDHKALGATVFRSLNERDCRTLLGGNPKIARYAIEPHTLRFYIPDGKGGFDPHIYVPDVVAEYTSGEIVAIDAKADFFTTRESWIRKEPHIRDAYKIDHGVEFAVIKLSTIASEPRLSNIQIMERHRYITPDAQAMSRVRETLFALGLPSTIGAISKAAKLASQSGECRAYTALMNLALAGEIHLDIGTAFSQQTLVREGHLA